MPVMCGKILRNKQTNKLLMNFTRFFIRNIFCAAENYSRYAASLSGANIS